MHPPEIENKINEIKKNEIELTRTKEDLILRNEELKTVQTEFKEKEKEFELSKSILEEKIEQNKSLLSLIHKTELENTAKDIVNNVKNASKGLKNMDVSEWNQLYAAVDKLHPDFPQLLIENCGHIDEQKMKLCYLMKIGLSYNQILNITGLPRTTAYRWMKQFKWIVQSDENDGIKEE